MIASNSHARAEVYPLAAQNESAVVQFPGFKRLPQHQQRLNNAALAHPVQAAQQIERRAIQVQLLKTLEIRKVYFF